MTKHVDNIQSLLISVLHWLENSDEDDRWWQLQTQVAQLCVVELDLVLKASNRTRDQESPSDVQAAGIVQKLREMVEAMLNRNRAVALETGRQALEEISNLE